MMWSGVFVCEIEKMLPESGADDTDGVLFYKGFGASVFYHKKIKIAL